MMKTASPIRGLLLGMVAGALCVNLAGAATPDSPPTQLGKQIEDFALRDFRGRERSLEEFKGKPVAVVFVGSDCPLAKLYAPRLEAIYQQFKDRGVGVVAINSNTQDSMQKVGAFARLHKLTYPVLKDPDNMVADLFEAERTPHAFVLDGDRVVRYVGRIDNQYGLGVTSGYAKSELESAYVVDAIEDLLAGDEVRVGHSEPTGCIIGRQPKIEPHGDVTYSDQISRILNNRCVSCHRPGEVAPFPLTNFEEVNGWGEMMLEVVDKGQMPPWFANPEFGEFKNDCRLSDTEKQLLHTWVDNGCPEGDPADLPEPPNFVEGWRIGEPDQVVRMEQPYNVAAEGVVEYQYFTMDPGWKEDKWIKMVDARPDNRAVVHHIIVFAQPPRKDGDQRRRRGRRGVNIGGFAPGSPATIYPEGLARFVPAGSKLIFQMHYTPNGSPQVDQSSVGIVFCDESEVEREAQGGMLGDFRFEIPPGEANHEVVVERPVRNDIYLTSMLPHMHLRGKSYRYEALYPDGREEVLLDVPNYDFNWQLRYEFVEPKLLPKGTILRGTAVFDNSADNISNPDPTAAVRYGDQTWEEMANGFYGSMPVQTRQQRAAKAAEQSDQASADKSTEAKKI